MTEFRLRRDARGELPPISADFVTRTLAKVMADRRQIEAEAEQVDSVRFERAALDAFAVPPPSPGFAERTLRAVQADRMHQAAELAADADVDSSRSSTAASAAPAGSPAAASTPAPAPAPAMAAMRSITPPTDPAAVPASTHAAVDRTTVLGPLLARRGPATVRPTWFRRAGWIAAAAIVVLTLFVVSRLPNRSPTDLAPNAQIVSAESYTPAPWSTAMARSFARDDYTEVPDPLVILAAGHR